MRVTSVLKGSRAVSRGRGCNIMHPDKDGLSAPCQSQSLQFPSNNQSKISSGANMYDLARRKSRGIFFFLRVGLTSMAYLSSLLAGTHPLGSCFPWSTHHRLVRGEVGSQHRAPGSEQKKSTKQQQRCCTLHRLGVPFVRTSARNSRPQALHTCTP